MSKRWWACYITTIVILLFLVIRFPQIEDFVETDKFETIKAIYIGLMITITLGIGLAVALFGRKK